MSARTFKLLPRMKTAIALRHIHFEDAGTLTTVLAEHGYQLRYIDPTITPTITTLDNASIQQSDLLIVLGGTMAACDEHLYPFLAKELAIVHQRLESGKPLLGICLGAQLIARALDTQVYSLGVKEIGFSPLTLTAAGEQSVLVALGNTPVLHWHGEQFDIPAGAVHLACTSIGTNQAFSIGRNVLGLQFHLEADVKRIEQWLVGHANELGQVGVDPCVLRADAEKLGDRLAVVAQAVFSAWLDRIEQNICNVYHHSKARN